VPATPDRDLRRWLRRANGRLPVGAPVAGLVSEPGIESRIADLVGSKKALFTGLFDGTSDEVTFARSGSFLSRVERIVAPAISPKPARTEDINFPEDEAADCEVESTVAAADESRDAATAATATREPSDSAAALQHLIAGVKEQRTTSGGLIIEAPPETASTLAALFAGMAELLQAVAAPVPR
jgi:hypothetical protein